MGVVHLNGEVSVQLRQGTILRSLDLKNVLQAARYEKELLCQPQFLALNSLVVRIKNLRDVLRRNLVGHSAEVVALVECLKVETFNSLRRPQPHGVGRVRMVAKDGSIE